MTQHLIQLVGFATLFSIFLVIYHHALYPLLLSRLAQQKNKKPHNSNTNTRLPLNEHPSIDVIIPVFNEEKTIKEKRGKAKKEKYQQYQYCK